MKYFAQVDDEEIEIDIGEEKGGIVQVKVTDRPLIIDLQQVADTSLYSLIVDQLSYEVFVEQQEGEYTVIIGGQLYRVQVQDERAKRLSAVVRKERREEGELALKAPMPGLIVRLDVRSGQRVAKGERLLVLEAMKMENELRSPRDATVRAIYVQKGQKVEHGGLLLSLA
ncbi:MAG: biotin/lipoyl-binding protein [Chloroflexi bacterium]|nr:biotin/lipoyl-binding protein [Chloroflexota bacterium]MCL5074786.1 biotin/lipoyl-binding protein [Chloroflexota bacterium]